MEYWREGEAVVSAFSCVGLKEHTGCQDCNGHKAPGFLFSLLFAFSVLSPKQQVTCCFGDRTPGIRSDAEMPDLQVCHF